MTRTEWVLASVALLLLASGTALDATLLRADPEPADASLDGRVVVLRAEAPLAALALAEAEGLLLEVNGVLKHPLTGADRFGEDGSGPRLAFLEGAGSMDTARLIGRSFETDVRIVTSRDTLPATRYWAGSAQEGSTLFLFGGATWPAGGTRVGQEMWLDTVLRIDVETGGVRTMGARLPLPLAHAGAAWVPTPTSSCPEGCIYLFGGEDETRAWLTTIFRYDIARDELTQLDATLPDGKVDAVALWTGRDILIVAGGSPTILRFDPARETIEPIGASPLTSVWGTPGFFDARASATCPMGCAYLLGGADPNTLFITFPNTPAGPFQRGNVVRIDPATGVAAPMRSIFPEARSGHFAAWDGTTAWVVGGLTCGESTCAAPATMLAFDPVSDSLRVAETSLPQRPLYGTLAPHGSELVVVGGIGSTDDIIVDPLGFDLIDPRTPLDRFIRLPAR